MKSLYWLSNKLFGRLTTKQRSFAIIATCAAIGAVGGADLLDLVLGS